MLKNEKRVFPGGASYAIIKKQRTDVGGETRGEADMEKTKKNLGFGFMRLPMQGEEVDLAQTQQMVDAFLAAGFNYFDTAHGYLDGRSETALKACLTSRYPREDYVLTNKLTANFFKTEADIRPFFESQLAACGVDDFDFYLMHAQSMKNFEHFKACRAYETAFALKAEGKVRHVGISFHDSAEMLDRILTEYPQLEAVQLQFNYVDYDDPAVQSRRCYEVCRKHGKPVIVMEPVRGGSLARLQEEAQKILADLHGGSAASYAIRYAAGFENVRMVLSGMSTPEQVEDFIRYPAVRPSILAKNNGLVYDFLLNDRKTGLEACVILDIPGVEKKKLAEYFCYHISEGNYQNIRFSFDGAGNTPRVILKGDTWEVLRLVNAYYTQG